MAAGAQTVEIASSTYGSCLDCFYLAGDADFAPAGRTRAAVPAPLKLTAGPAGPGRARLTWTGDRDRRWYHYNVYCSAKPDAPADRRTLIASPDAETFLDWQAGGGDRYYTVTQVTLDGLESARSNEVRVEVAPPRPATSAPAKAGAD